jgi:hypothetical protein
MALSMGGAFLAVAVIAPLLGLLAALVLGLGAYRREEARLGGEARTHARALASGVGQHLRARLDALEAAASDLEAGGPPPPEGRTEAQRRRLRSRFPDLGRLVLADVLSYAVDHGADRLIGIA